MQISERAALVSAMAEGKFHVYPAGRLIQLIKKELKNNAMIENFEPGRLIDRINNINLGLFDADTKYVLEQDLNALCHELSNVIPEYDFDSDLARISKAFPAVLQQYFGIKGYQPTPTKIVEYFFEGYSDVYKNADWFAFNMSPEESRAMRVPIGSYFKRNQISSAHILISILHEKLHGVYSLLAEPENVHRSPAWLEEGFCDVFAYLMCYRIFLDRAILNKERNIIREINVLDPRKATYHYGMILFVNLLRSGGLPFFRALLDVQKEYTYDIDLNALVALVLSGRDPNESIRQLFAGADKPGFERRFGGLCEKYSKEHQLSAIDNEVLNFFSMIQPPAAISAGEYRAALWFNEQVTKNIERHVIEIEGDQVKPVKDISEEDRRGVNGFGEKILVMAESVPGELLAAADKLSNKYFIVKREIGGKVVYSPWLGGLPFRFASGELRCAFEV